MFCFAPLPTFPASVRLNQREEKRLTNASELKDRWNCSQKGRNTRLDASHDGACVRWSARTLSHLFVFHPKDER